MPLYVPAPVTVTSIATSEKEDVASKVWAHLPNRRLTNLNDIRAARIDKIVTLQEEVVGTLTADGSEQTVVERTAIGTLEGHIDLFNMQAGDTVVIKEYIMLKTGGTYRLYDSATYSNAQAKPNIHVVKLPAKYGVKVTLQQTAGVNRTYDYNFFREVLA